MTVSQALKSKEFWIIWFVWIFMGAAGISMINLSKSYSIAIGKPGVTILTTFNLANGIIRIFMGWLTDKIGPRLTGTLGFLLATIGYFIMPHTTNVSLVSLCAAGVGIGFGTLFTISGPLAADIFGLKNFGTIYGIIFIAYGLVSGIVGPAISGMILERTNNNYFVVFIYLGIMSLFGTILILCIKEKKTNKNIKDNIENKNENENENENIEPTSNPNSSPKNNTNTINNINEKASVTIEIECENKSTTSSL
ncbi:MFS general substrate transporter [Anaeromyces robustus]|uniref:MFS general substrate transporter n=1 Tax=Anaeromyces robustus TaxID=1754192 RepID=A0A1Y1WWT5_9FUNG|nr:MFS general substrate transporter [Anaeromyces robustus]|eukprot:ORX77666.1 MFS general substrate transporter [Anaeromyces robustus]